MSITTLMSNIYLWIILSFVFLLLFIVTVMFVFILGMKTHALIEFRAWMKGNPIALFFQENRYCDWKPVKPEAGIIEDKNYGSFIINPGATYIDKKTKNVLIPFDASFGSSVNVHAAKLADDLKYVIRDEEQMKELRQGIANGNFDENQTIDALKTSIHFSAIKSMMTALTPHNITGKIEKVIAQRMKGVQKINVPYIIMLFCAMFGAILLGGFIVRYMLK